MESTTLSLLADNGVVELKFTPALSGAHYTDLLAVVELANTDDEMRAMVKNWATRLGLTLEVS